MINGNNGAISINADRFNEVELAGSNAKIVDIKVDWVELRVKARVIVDAVSLKLDIFIIKISAWLTIKSGQLEYKPEKKNLPTLVNKALI